jgi:hypothetical protein
MMEIPALHVFGALSRSGARKGNRFFLRWKQRRVVNYFFLSVGHLTGYE